MSASAASETSQRASIAAWNAASHVAGCTAACRASTKTMPSGVCPRLGATGVGAVFRIQLSARVTIRAWRK